MPEHTLFNIFHLPDCTQIEWDKQKPTYVTEANHCRTPPIFLCKFDVWQIPISFFGAFDDCDSRHLFGPIVFRSDWHYDLAPDDDYLTVAYAIGELRAFEFSEMVLNQPLEDAVEILRASTIAAYRTDANLRASFPRLEQFLTGKTDNGGYIYLLSDQQGHYKIGHTKDLDKRIYQLGTQPPFAIKLLKSCWVPHRQRVEKWLHDINTEFRMRGEWFAFPDVDLERACNWFDCVNAGNERVRSVYFERDWSDWREIRRRSPEGWPYDPGPPVKVDESKVEACIEYMDESLAQCGLFVN